MKISSIVLSQFRNLNQQRFDFGGASWFFHGPNGQGKTNLLEALYLISAFRSFRTASMSPLPVWGQREFTLQVDVDHEIRGGSSVVLSWNDGVRQVMEDGNPLKLAEFLGVYPVVALTSEDVEWIRGSPALRRRQQDLFLSMLSSRYLVALRAYHHAMRQRNVLLRQGERDSVLYAVYERAMASSAMVVEGMRAEWTLRLKELLVRRYQHMVPTGEPVDLVFEADLDEEDEEGYCRYWSERRAQDQIAGTTRRGPHRSDWTVQLKEHSVREYGSEGQQRGIVLALRLSQYDLLHEVSKIQPVLLADDVLHELDQQRRSYFWQTLPADVQIFASGTVLPDEWRGEVLTFPLR
jgi:DNA replication and repair protein RecF